MTAWAPPPLNPLFSKYISPACATTTIIARQFTRRFVRANRIPLQPVPITGRTFAVLLISFAWSKRGAATMIAYIAQGALGLPFFAGGASGSGLSAGQRWLSAGICRRGVYWR